MWGKDPFLAAGDGCRADAVDMNISANAKSIDHPCPKPVQVWTWLIERVGHKRDLFYDPFSGSGTTIIACERLNRKCRAVEISPAYVAVSIERWHQMTGGEPVMLDTVDAIKKEL